MALRSSGPPAPLPPPLAPLLWRLVVVVCAVTAASLLKRLATAALTPAFGAVLSAAAVQRLALATAVGGFPLVLGARRHWPAGGHPTRSLAVATTALPPVGVAAAATTAAVWPLLAPVLPHALGAYSLGIGAVANAAFAAATAGKPPPATSGWLAGVVYRGVAAARIGPAAAVGAVTATAATAVGAAVVGPPAVLAAAAIAAVLPSQRRSVPPWWWLALATTTGAAVMVVRWGALSAVGQFVGRPAAATGGAVTTCLMAAIAVAVLGGLAGPPPHPAVPAGQGGRGGGRRNQRRRDALAGTGAAVTAVEVAPLLTAVAVPVVAVAAALWAGAGAPPLPPDGWVLHDAPGGSSTGWRPSASAAMAGSPASGVPWPARVSVLTHVSREHRPTMLAVDHSLLGGEWATGDTIFGVFNIHEAVVLSRGRAGRSAAEAAAAAAAAAAARLQAASGDSGASLPRPSPPPRARTALVLGVGAGCSAKGLTAAGYTVTGVEVDAAVAAAATGKFGCALASRGRLFIDDAAAYVRRAVVAGTTYDAVLLDVFSGGGVALHMFSPSVVADVAAVVAPGGVLVVNTVGLLPPLLELESVPDDRQVLGTVQSGDLKDRVGTTPTVDWAAGITYDGIPAAAGALAPHFPHLRAFVDTPPSRSLHNVVLFAGDTAEAVSFRAAVPGDGVLGSTLRAEELADFVHREVTSAVASRMAAMAATEGYGGGGWRRAMRGTRWVDAIRRAEGVSAAEHWRVMRIVMGAPVWAALAVG
ncbi:hypothetical protein MMPV_000199 [Pyropia vietnamensis]